MPHTTLEIFIRRLPSGSLAADGALSADASYVIAPAPPDMITLAGA